MRDINPYNLGPPVYKAEQVITQFDLRYILAELNELEATNLSIGVPYERLQAVRNSLELLLDWLVSGKGKNIITGE